MQDDSAGTGVAQYILSATRYASYTNGISKVTESDTTLIWNIYVRQSLDPISS